MSRTTEKGSVLVIGAGLAGLMAAWELQRGGWRVTVLEARARVGGRVYTLRDGWADGQWAEAGGEYIDGVHERMLALVAHFDLGLDTAEPTALKGIHYFDGKLTYAEAVPADVAEEFENLWHTLSAMVKRLPKTDPLSSAEAAALDSQTLAAWLDSQAIRPAVRRLMEYYLLSEYLVSTADVSLLYMAITGAEYETVSEVEVEAYRVAGGNSRLTGALAKDLADVRLAAPVTTVHLGQDRVRAAYLSPQGVQSVEADYAVLAVPLGAAWGIRFDPPLPSEYHAMFSGVSYGPATKVMLQYRRRFWQAAGYSGELLTDLPISIAWEATGKQPGEGGILTIYNGAQPAMTLASLSDEQRIALAVAEIDMIFPGSKALFERGATVAWVNEPYSRGGYAAFGPGELVRFGKLLSQPVGRLQFAGEHTTLAFQGYMEGAVLSGQRAAGAIDPSLSLLPGKRRAQLTRPRFALWGKR